jgi:hypothetical protein
MRPLLLFLGDDRDDDVVGDFDDFLPRYHLCQQKWKESKKTLKLNSSSKSPVMKVRYGCDTIEP